MQKIGFDVKKFVKYTFVIVIMFMNYTMKTSVGNITLAKFVCRHALTY